MKYGMSINAMSIVQPGRRCLSHAAGNLKTSTDARGMTTTYSYDALNRLTGIVYGDNVNGVIYQYDSTANGTKGIGRLTRIVDGAALPDYSYDVWGRLTRSVFRDGPRNGNWGGGKWSDGVPPSGRQAPNSLGLPLDSADACYMKHDLCYDSKLPKKACDARQVNELTELPDDPRKWLLPPRAGTDQESRSYRDGAISIFK